MATDKGLIEVGRSAVESADLQVEIEALQSNLQNKASALMVRANKFIAEDILPASKKHINRAQVEDVARKKHIITREITAFEKETNKKPDLYTHVSKLEWAMMNFDTQNSAARDCQLARIDLLRAEVLKLSKDLVKKCLTQHEFKEPLSKDVEDFEQIIQDGNVNPNSSIFTTESKFEKKASNLFIPIDSSQIHYFLRADWSNLQKKRDQLTAAIKTASLTPEVQAKFRSRLYLALPFAMVLLVGLGLVTYFFPPVALFGPNLFMEFFGCSIALTVVAPFYYAGLRARFNPFNPTWSMNDSRILKYFAADYSLRASTDTVLLQGLLPKADTLEECNGSSRLMSDSLSGKDIPHVVGVEEPVDDKPDVIITQVHAEPPSLAKASFLARSNSRERQVFDSQGNEIEVNTNKK